MKRFILATFVLCLFTALAIAQSTSGVLVGTVSGPDGLLPGATVTLTDNQTGRVLTTTTNDSGGFRFSQISFGTYTVRVSADGFKTYVATELKIDANQTYTLNPKLELGDVAAEVTVSAGAEIVNSSNAELSTTVSPKQVLDLPINGRNPLALLNLQAGVNATSSSINGQRSSSVNYTRDGINVQDNFIRTGGFVQDRPTVDDTGEFTVVTQNSGAELGNGGSTQVLLVTPRGGSEFSGAAYIYNRNSAFAANEFGNNALGVEKPFLNRNQFGGKLSGPIPIPGVGQGTPIFFKDKGFFFVNYERFLLRQTNSVTTSTLLPQFRDGTFTYTANDGTTQTVNILTGAGLLAPIPAAANGPGSANPVTGVDPIIQQRILSRLPNSGNGPIQNGGLTQQNLFNVSDNTTRDTFITRIDVEITDKHNIYGVYRFVDNQDQRPDVEFGFEDPFVNVTSYNRFFVAAWRSVWGSNFSNELRVSYTDNNPFFAESENFPTDYIIGGLPFITDPNPSFQDQGRVTNQYTFQNNATFTFGNHTFRFGGEHVRQIIDTQTNFNRVPVYNLSTGGGATPFDALESNLFPGGIGGTALGRANSLRALLGGVIGSGTVAANYQGPNIGPVIGSTQQQNFRYSTTGLYISDQWRVRPNLTLTLGLRYDFFSPLENPEQVYLEPDLEGAETFDAIRTALIDSTGQYDIIGTNTGTPGRFFNPDYNNFGPNIAVAWSPNFESGPLGWFFGKNRESTIRGGFRIGYINDEFIRGSDNALGGNDGLNFTVDALQNGSALFNARLNNLPGFTLPNFQNPPISFATNNANDPFTFNTVFAVDPNLEIQQNFEWNIGYQREIGFDTAIEFRYVGGMSNNMHQAFDFNQVRINEDNFYNDFLTIRNNCRSYIAANNANPANPTRYLDGRCSFTEYLGLAGAAPGVVAITTPSALLNARFLPTSTAQGIVGQAAVVWVQNRNLARTFFVDGFEPTVLLNNANAGVVDLLTNAGKYRYNALQAEIRRRFTDGLQFQANYTFQKTLTDSGTDNQSRFNPYLDFARPELEYARADYDRTHTININANYELPFGKGKPFLNQGGIVDKIFGGFQLTTIMNISSGAPISIKDINGTLNRTGRSNRQTANSSLTPDQIADLIGINFVDGRVYFIDPSVIGPDGSATNGNVEPFADDRFPGQVFFRVQPGFTGNLPRAFLNGPWYYNVDAGLIKNIRFGERFRVQLRAEAFNLLNKTNWFIGQNTGTFDIDDAAGTTFGEVPVQNTFSPRIMQFAFRFEF